MARFNIHNIFPLLLVSITLLLNPAYSKILPTRAEFEKAMGNPPANSLVFFSGPGRDYIQNFERAYTQMVGKPIKLKTVSTLLKEGGLEARMPAGAGDPAGYFEDFWSLASTIFAEKASGIVYAFVPETGALPTSYYSTYERPVLKSSKDVTSLIEVNANGDVGKQTVIKGTLEVAGKFVEAVRDPVADAAALAAINNQLAQNPKGKVPLRFQRKPAVPRR